MTLKLTPKIGMAALIASLAVSPVALAQVDEIIVTAAKREQTLQEVPIAVSVTTAETIEQAQIVDLIDLQTVVPSLRITQLQSSANTNFIIRGFGNGANNPGIEPSVGVYIDGVYRSRSGSSLADLSSVERIEVLRGPQTTLFGKNASAGVISITTSLPEDEFGAMVEANFGNYGSTIVKGTVTGPIVDSLAFRLTGSVNQNDGYYTNLSNGESLNGRNRWQLRGQLLAELGDAVTLRVIGDYNSTDEKCCGASMILSGAATGVADTITANVRAGLGLPAINAPDGGTEHEIGLTFNPTNELEGKGISAQFDVDMGNMQFVSISSYREQGIFSRTDGDFNYADLLGSNVIRDNFETFTQELRLTSNSDSPLQWMVGAYYFDEDVKHFRDATYGAHTEAYVDALIQGLTAPFGPPISGDLDNFAALLTSFGVTVDRNGVPVDRSTWYQPGQGLVSEYFEMQNEAISLFGSIDYAITDRMTATLGLSYTEDEKTVVADVDIDDPFSTIEFSGALIAFAGLQFFPPFQNYPNANETGIFESDDLTHNLRFAYEWNDSTNIYLSHSTGFKATSVNMSVDARVMRSAGPEEATNIEFGIKKNLGNGFVNFAVFEQEIDDFQSNLFNGTGFDLANAGLQVHTGAEIEAVYTFGDNLTLTASATYLDPKYKTYNTPPPSPALPSPSDLTGQEPAGVHEVSVNLGAVYAYELGADSEAYFRVEYFHESDVQIADNVPKNIASREVNLVNASYGIENTKYGWGVRAWIRNLTDDEYLIAAFPTTAAIGSFSGYVTAPRTYGLALRQNF